MAQIITTFERKETKYVLSADQITAVKAALAPYMHLDSYGRTRIDSLYFDTPGNDIIIRSLEKPLYKEKLRVRAYGDVTADSPVFVELKKKFKGIVYKRRVCMTYAAANAYLRGMSYEQALVSYPLADDARTLAGLSAANIQIAREIDAFIDRYPGIAPAMVISCQREAYKATAPQTQQDDVRITFDERISYVDVKDGFSYASAHEDLDKDFALEPGKAVMEIKCAGAYPLWLVEILSKNGVFPASFSKYGTAFRIVTAQKRAAVGAKRVAERTADHAAACRGGAAEDLADGIRPAALTRRGSKAAAVRRQHQSANHGQGIPLGMRIMKGFAAALVR